MTAFMSLVPAELDGGSVFERATINDVQEEKIPERSEEEHFGELATANAVVANAGAEGGSGRHEQEDPPNEPHDARDDTPHGFQNARRNQRQRERRWEKPSAVLRHAQSTESLDEEYQRPNGNRSGRVHQRSEWLMSGTTLASRGDGEPEEAPRNGWSRPRRRGISPEEHGRDAHQMHHRRPDGRLDDGFEDPLPDRLGRRRTERLNLRKSDALDQGPVGARPGRRDGDGGEPLGGRPRNPEDGRNDAGADRRKDAASHGTAHEGGPPGRRWPRRTDDSRLVVAVDYGTTYSGVGYASVSNDDFSLDDIEVIRAWGQKMFNERKVPSVISYTPGAEQQWGKDLSSNAIALIHTKLQLDVDSVSGELDFILQALDGMKNLNFGAMIAEGGLPSYTEKSPEQIVQHYLTKLFHGGLANLRRNRVEEFSQRSLSDTPTDIVITHPSDWSYMAKNSTYRAVTRAGFNRKYFPALKEVMMISEPEAAAVYTARYMREMKQEDFLESQDYFVLCDAGGGTVDVVSYKVLQTTPSLRLERVGLPSGMSSPPDGYKCGSTYINLEFKHWLRRLLRDDNYRRLDPNPRFRNLGSHTVETEAMRRLMEEFNSHKEHFGPDSDDILIQLPPPLDSLHMPPSVTHGQLKIPRDTMREFFGTCIRGIIDLIKQQLYQIGQRNSDAKHIFLVGGFAESEYLQNALDESLQRRKKILWRPETSQTAVARGAVICGIEKSSASSLATIANPCLRSYGIVVDKPYSEVTCNPNDRGTHAETRQMVAAAQMHWLISKGDLVLPNEPRVRYEFSTIVEDDGDGTGQVKIWSCDEDEEYRPDRFAQSRHKFQEVAVLQYDLSRFGPDDFGPRRVGVGRLPFRLARLTVVVGFKDGELRAAVKFKNETLTSTAIPYYPQ